MHNEKTTDIILSNHILKVLAYFDYFHFPLQTEQIIFYLGCKAESTKAIHECLNELVSIGKIECDRGYYGLTNLSANIDNRLSGEENFRQLRDRIRKSCNRISYFPFVKFIGLSGSMSKGYAPPNADIDFFIVTEKNRLWLCKILLHLLKTASMLKGSQRWYCLNYYVDVTAMRIEEKNIFTAVELASLKPLIDEGNYYEQLIQHNEDWLKEIIPNFSLHSKVETIQPRKNFFSQLLSFFSTDGINRWVMHLTDGDWRKRKRRSRIPADQYSVVIKTRENISKRHYRNFQKRMLDHQEKVEKILLKEEL